MLESQISYIVDALRKFQRNGLRYLDLRRDVQDAFNQEVQERMKSTVWAQGCTSWYQTAAGKNTNNWPGLTFEYRNRTLKLELDHYVQVKA